MEEPLKSAFIDVMNRALSNLVSACMDEQGNPKAPSKQELMKARSLLPQKYPGTLIKPKVRT